MNFVLQATNVQGLGTRLGGGWVGGTRLIQQFVDYRTQVMVVQAKTVTWRT